MSGQRFYEEDEAQEILRRALHQGASGGGVDRSRLVSMAAELGISESDLARAEAQMAQEREARASEEQLAAERAEFRRSRWRGFLSDLTSYISVNAFMVAIWWFSGKGYFWPFWVMAGWGIGIVSHLFSALGGGEAEFEKWRRKKRLRRAAEAQLGEVSRYLDEIMPLLEGQKIETIKQVRERFGLGLKEAKDAVEEWEAKRAF